MSVLRTSDVSGAVVGVVPVTVDTDEGWTRLVRSHGVCPLTDSTTVSWTLGARPEDWVPGTSVLGRFVTRTRPSGVQTVRSECGGEGGLLRRGVPPGGRRS